MDLYRSAIRPLVFSGLKIDPEWAHTQALDWLSRLGNLSDPSEPWQTWLNHQFHQSFCVDHPALQQTMWNLSFPNPMGLAAGFDKDGVAAGALPSFGFGHLELGTVTWHPQPGNAQPRLFRLVPDRAILNRMGFNNGGAKALAEQLQALKTSTHFPIPIGINLGKSKITPLEEAPADYCQSFQVLQPLGDYFVINVSSPNTPGLRSLQAVEQLDAIITTLQDANTQQKPLFVKIAPDLTWDAIAEVVDLCQRRQLAGIIATNTTIERTGLQTQKIAKTGNDVKDEAGGLSGAPLRQRSTEVIRFIWKETQGSLPIIGVGGVFTADDAWEKITAGASLIQTYTGWIYEGPSMMHRVLTGLLQRIEQNSLSNISEAIGSANS